MPPPVVKARGGDRLLGLACAAADAGCTQPPMESWTGGAAVSDGVEYGRGHRLAPANL